MNVVNQLYPQYEQLAPLAENGSPDPICMVNLLKFRDKAEYPDGRASSLSGREAYMLYADPMQRIVEGAGGRFLFGGDVQALIVGEADEVWDLVGIVEYPSRAAFHKIATSPEVQEIGVHRTAGLDGQWLIAATPEDG